MVTHDVNMKYYSHRVLKVLDGKIIGEEVIDPSVRQHHLQELAERIKVIHQREEEPAIDLDHNVEKRKVETYGAIKWLR